jgi:hypothetical protein
MEKFIERAVYHLQWVGDSNLDPYRDHYCPSCFCYQRHPNPIDLEEGVPRDLRGLYTETEWAAMARKINFAGQRKYRTIAETHAHLTAEARGS